MLQNPTWFVFPIDKKKQMSEQVLTTAFVQLRTRILQFATRFFPAEDDADDALQDAFCRLWAHRDEIKTINEAEALAKTTVRNLAIDSYRRRNAMPTDDIETVAVADDSPPADERVVVEERFRMVESIIVRHLTPQQQAIVRLREFEQQSFSEIAARLSMEEPAVRVQLSRARKKIRECYYNLQNDESKR